MRSHWGRSLPAVVASILALGGCSLAPAKEPEAPSATPDEEPASSPRTGTQRGEAHVVEPGDGVTYQPTDKLKPLRHLRESIPELPTNGVVHRIVLADIAYPSSAEEDRALDGWTLVLLTALSHEERELPLARAFIRSQAGELPLQAAIQKRSTVPDSFSDVAEVFGRHRFDALYYFPTGMVLVPVTIFVDFSAARTDFEVLRFPVDSTTLQSLPAGVDLNRAPGTPSPSAVEAFVAREFPFMAPSDKVRERAAEDPASEPASSR